MARFAFYVMLAIGVSFLCSISFSLRTSTSRACIDEFGAERRGSRGRQRVSDDE